MPLYCDPSETRENTRLPQSILDAATEVPGLENATGADILISLVKMPRLTKVTDDEFSQNLLRRHCESGLLIQRKTGRDLTSSITKFPDILQRMLLWTPRPWLLGIADIKVDRDGQAIIDGAESGFTYAALDGALSYWQLRGGYVTILPNERLMAGWVNGWLKRLEQIKETPMYAIFRPPQQAVISMPRWMETLATFPLIGHERAQAVAEYAGTLWAAIDFLTDPPPGHSCPGVGPETIRRARLHLQLPDGLCLKVAEQSQNWEKEKAA